MIDRRWFVTGSAAAVAAGALVPGEVFAAVGKPEKKKLRVGFIPIACATPLIIAKPLGFYAKYGLDVELVKLPSWVAMQKAAVNGELDAFHLLSPMPISISLGLGTPTVPMKLASIENVNGQAITLSKKLLGRVNTPADFKGLRLGVPFTYSMHNLLLRYYLAGAGLNPDRDLTIVNVPPPKMVHELTAGTIDGFLGPEPTNQRAVYNNVGFIHILSKEIWNGHPCCAFAAQSAFIKDHPNSFDLLNRAIIDAAHFAHDQSHREEIARVIAPKLYLNQPEHVMSAILTGQYNDGKHNENKGDSDRVDFQPYPLRTYSYWIMSQLQRWKYITSPIDYQTISDQVFLTDLARSIAHEVGFDSPPTDLAPATLMYDTFDPKNAREYLESQRARGHA